MPEVEKKSPEEFNDMQNALNTVQATFNAFVKNLESNLKSAGLVAVKDNDTLSTRLGPQNEEFTKAATSQMRSNEYGAQEAWTAALTDPDQKVGAKKLTKMIYDISKANQAKNMAQTTKQQGRVHYYEGANLMNIIGAQRTIIQQRLTALNDLLHKMAGEPIVSDEDKNETPEEKPITKESLARLRELARRL